MNVTLHYRYFYTTGNVASQKYVLRAANYETAKRIIFSFFVRNIDDIAFMHIIKNDSSS